jgi:hypothetical protein
MDRRRRRLLLCFLGVAACAIGAGALSATGTAAKSKLLSGKTKIRKLELLRLTGGPHRGALLVWADVVHGLAAAKSSGKASDLGLLRVELLSSKGSDSGKDRYRIPLTSQPPAAPPENGYRVMIPGRRAKALGSGPIQIRAQASQTLDLNGDGEVDATGMDTERTRRRATSVAQTYPQPGTWGFSDFTTNYLFTTNTKSVTLFSAFGRKGDCSFQDPMHSPVDPESGFFKHYDGTVDVSGQFNSATTAIVTGDVSVGGCYQDFLHEANFTLGQ